MKRAYIETDRKFDRDEDGNIVPSHDCCDYLHYRECTSTEPHGEVFNDSWYQCEFCDEKFTDREVEAMMNPVPRKGIVSEGSQQSSNTEVA